MKVAAATAVLCAVAAVAPGAASPAHKPPQLQLVRTQPLTVSGTRFHPQELVRLVVDGHVVARKTTTRSGTFRAVATGVVLDRCTDAIVYAIGIRGDKALLGKLPKLACAPS